MKTRGFVVVLMLMVAAGPATAFCNELGVLMQPGRDVAINHPTTGAPAKCQISHTLGRGPERNCYWAFDYRAKAAKDAFDTLLQHAIACMGGDVDVLKDQQVNHPDAYDLRLLERDGVQVAVSLKDKGGLSQTLVFLRVAIAP